MGGAPRRAQVTGARMALPPRPGFKGIVMRNPKTGSLEIDFPPSKRKVRVALSSVLTSALTCALLATVVGIFILKHNLTEEGASDM